LVKVSVADKKMGVWTRWGIGSRVRWGEQGRVFFRPRRPFCDRVFGIVDLVIDVGEDGVYLVERVVVAVPSVPSCLRRRIA